MNHKVKVLISAREIQRRIHQLGMEINAAYRGKTLVVIGILNGSLPLVADLIRQLPDVDVRLETMRIKSYRGQRKSGKATCQWDDRELRGLNAPVLLVDDIYDTGHTLHLAKQAILRSKQCFTLMAIKTLVLLKKRGTDQYGMAPDYVGFRVPKTAWVYGYGLDLDGKERHRKDIRVLQS